MLVKPHATIVVIALGWNTNYAHAHKAVVLWQYSDQPWFLHRDYLVVSLLENLCKLVLTMNWPLIWANPSLASTFR